MQINVSVTDANNIVCNVVPPQTQVITIDRGVAGNGIVSIVPVTISTFQYLRITYTNGTVQDVGPLTSTAYTATAPITIVGNTISLSTVPIASGGTGATTAATAIQNLLPSYTGNANKRLGLNSGGTALEWVLDGGGTVTSVAASGGTTGLTFTGSPITTSGTLTLGGTLAVASGGTGVTTSTGTGSVVLSTSPSLVTPLLGTPTSGNFSTGTFTWPTFNQNTTGTAANITATSNSTLTTLSALSLPGSQVSGNISGNAANVTGVVAILNGGSGQTTAQAAMNSFAGAITSGFYLRGNGTNVVMSAIQAADVPTLNQNTTGTAANITGVVAIANGGTGQITANAAFNALAPSQVGQSGKYLTTDGTNTSWATNPLGTVTSVSGAGTVNGLTLTGTVTTSGSLTLGGTLSGIANSALTNSSITIGGTTIALGGSSNALANDITINSVTVGRGAGSISTNTAVGASALAANTTGSSNSGFGVNALNSNQDGIQNSAFGYQALNGNVSGYYNVAMGYRSLFVNTGNSNVGIGTQALQANTTAQYGTAVGYQAGYSNTTGSDLTVFGNAAGRSNTTGTLNTAVGSNALYTNTTGGNNTAMGYQSLFSNTTSSNNTAVGYQAGYSNTTGTTLTAFGYRASYGNTTGGNNIAIGDLALFGNQTGNQNIAIGPSALYDTTASQNIGIGQQALRFNTSGGSNTAIGFQSLFFNTTASNNTAVGYQAGYAITTGVNNTLFGYGAGKALTTPNQNTFVGINSGSLITTGANNTILGNYSGNQGGLDIRTANNWIVLSDGDGNPRGVFDNSGNFMVGATSPSARATFYKASGDLLALQSGNGNTGVVYYAGATSGTFAYFVNAALSGVGSITQTNTATAYNTSSDQRLKENIQNAAPASDLIDSLQVRQFDWKSDGSHQRYGFVAQELATVYPEAVHQPVDTEEMMAVDYSKLVPLLVKEIQSLKARLNAANL